MNQQKALERLWTDRCTVYIKEKHKNPHTKITGFEDKMLFDGLCCKLSFETLSAASGDGSAAVSQSVKLFLSPEYSVPPGSKIIVTRPDGKVLTYSHSGQVGTFSHHQEILLDLLEEWA